MAQNMGIIKVSYTTDISVSLNHYIVHRYNKSDNFNQVSHSISAKQLL